MMIKRLTPLAALVAVAAPAALAAAPTPTSVTLAAQPSTVVYGSSTTLNGAVAPVAANVKVTVTAQPCGTTSAKNLANATTNAQGAWTTTTKPNLNTTYEAKVKKVVSTKVTVQVRPQVTLQKIAAHMFRTQATAAQSFAGKIALFQKRTATGWRTVKSVVLQQISTGPAPTIVSGATFRSGIRRGKTVRVLLTQRQVGTCYLPGTSNTIKS